MSITPLDIQKFQKLITESKHIVITAHKSPDGDSIGSSLGLYHYLKKKTDHTVVICHPDPAPDFLHWLPGQEDILNLDEYRNKVEQHFDKADLIFCLDYNSISRIGGLEKLMTNSDAKRIMIDHHRDPDESFCDIMFSDITACSTCQLIYEVIQSADDINLIDEIIGTALYTGIMTDTGSFRFSSTLPKTHVIVANLMNKGVNHAEIHERIYDTNSLDRIQLVSYAMLEKLEINRDYQVGYLALTQEEQERFNAQKGDTEGIVNQILGVKGVLMAVFFKEVDGLVKISFRSKRAIPVNNLARENFGGGGHLNASGGKFVGKIDDAVDRFVTILPRFVEENKKHFS